VQRPYQLQQTLCLFRGVDYTTQINHPIFDEDAYVFLMQAAVLFDSSPEFLGDLGIAANLGVGLELRPVWPRRGGGVDRIALRSMRRYAARPAAVGRIVPAVVPWVRAQPGRGKCVWIW